MREIVNKEILLHTEFSEKKDKIKENIQELAQQFNEQNQEILNEENNISRKINDTKKQIIVLESRGVELKKI
jgi:hypothetical protein